MRVANVYRPGCAASHDHAGDAHGAASPQPSEDLVDGHHAGILVRAAERGFASRSYKRVYTEYHQVAEESLAKDDIPGGYRFYVKRYFQLIRPREGK